MVDDGMGWIVGVVLLVCVPLVLYLATHLQVVRMWSVDRQQQRYLLVTMAALCGADGVRALGEAWPALHGDLPVSQLQVRGATTNLGTAPQAGPETTAPNGKL